eukprot:gene9344-biopygen19720
MQRRRRCQEREHAIPPRSVRLHHVLPCSVMCCSVLLHPVLCSVLFRASSTNPTKPTQTNTTTPQHHTTATQWGPKMQSGAEGTGGKAVKAGAQAQACPGCPLGLLLFGGRERGVHWDYYFLGARTRLGLPPPPP